jgi:DNA-binding response OmpR family regulator
MAASILLVEDDPTLVRSIARTLTAHGYAVTMAMTVADAHAALVRERPAVLVLDIDLPDGSGWEVLRSLRAEGATDVPTLVMSALRPNQRLADELGVLGVLEKPFPIESLLRLIAGACGRSAPPAPDMDLQE